MQLLEAISSMPKVKASNGTSNPLTKSGEALEVEMGDRVVVSLKLTQAAGVTINIRGQVFKKI
jgi:hypothetical protein